MAKHVIFLVHGMGVYSKKNSSDIWIPDDTLWHNAQIDILSNLFSNHIEINDGENFSKVFEVVPIHYDQIFTNVLQGWTDRADDIFKTVTGDALDMGNKIMGWMKKGNLFNDFFFTHFGDVCLYRYFDHFEQAVLATVQRQMMEKIVISDTGEQPTWSIIGHSLGTKIVHDAVDSLYRDSTINIGDEIKPAEVIALIANVCDVLERPNQEVSDSSVYPSNNPSNNSACRHLISTSHKWDFFTQVDPYKPSGGRWSDAKTSNRFVNVRNFDTIDPDTEDWWDVHSLYNYLRHPGIYIPLFMKMLGKPSYIFPKEKLDNAIRVFEEENSINEIFDSRFDGAKKKARKKLRAKLKQQYKSYIKPDLEEFIKQLKSKEVPWKDK